MVGKAERVRWLAATLLFASAVGTAGCGGTDGVELNGKLFDAVGLSGDVLGKKPEPRTQARAPLVLPPDATRLPEPGSAPEPGAVEQAWPRDAQQQKLAEAEARKRAHEEYCKNGNWKEKAVKDEIAADKGPDGSCQGSIFSAIGKSLGGKSGE